MLPMEWNGEVFKDLGPLAVAIYQSMPETHDMTTKDAANAVLAKFAMYPYKCVFLEIVDALDAARSSGNPDYVTYASLEAARAHDKATKAAFKGDRTEWAAAYRHCSKRFVSYLEMLNRCKSREEAEASVT